MGGEMVLETQAPRLPSVAEAAERFFPLMIAGDAVALRALLAPGAQIHQPLWGSTGFREVPAMVAQACGWLGAHRAAVEPVATTVGDRRAVVEQLLELVLEGRRIRLPVAVVAERAAAGVVSVRTYHSTWPLTGGHLIRRPLLHPHPVMPLPDVVSEYQRALSAGDLIAIVNTFEDDAYVREPSGSQFVYRGRDQITAMYRSMFGNGGGIPLEHCSLTDDGVRCAIEYNCVRWGESPLPPQAGVAVYARGKTARLSAARIYDDVEPPAGAH
ncbi:MAG: nuclear transport factor 2 family protein [Myxococcaceae bacterium]